MDCLSFSSRKRVLSDIRFWVLAIILAGAPAACAGDKETVAYSLEAIWTRPYDSETAVGFLDPEKNSIPEELYGVAIATDGQVLVSDRIGDRAILINMAGETAAYFGQPGEGPEDHRHLGEPVFLHDGNYGLFDCSFAKKLVSFKADGQYCGTAYLGGYEQYVRLMRCGDGYLGLAVVSQAEPRGGIKLDLCVATLWPNGAVRDTLWLGSHGLPPADPDRRMKEEDFEIIPKLASGPAGRVFVQNDLYRWRIECLDSKLQPVWTIEQDVKARERTPEELKLRRERMMQKLIPARRHHVIRQLVPRDSGALWVRSDNTNEAPGQMVFSQWSAEGQRSSDVVISGLPLVAGRVVIEGEWLFWTRHPDWELEADRYEDQPYMAFYRLAETGSQ